MAPSPENLGPFEWHSSSIDWCEGNYHVVSFVAEFFNTTTNLPFLVGPILSIWLMRDYFKQQGWSMAVLYILVQVVGIGSAYFHCTLSFAGQVIDELAILWLLAYGLALCLPPKYYNRLGMQTSTQWHVHVLLLALCASVTPYTLGRAFSVVVAPAMLAGGLPLTLVVYDHTLMLGNKIPAICWRLFWRAVILLFSGVFCWLLDRLVCPFPQSSLQLHAIWHLCTYAFATDFIAFLCFISAHIPVDDVENTTLILRFWPSDKYPLHPYVVFGRKVD